MITFNNSLKILFGILILALSISFIDPDDSEYEIFPLYTNKYVEIGDRRLMDYVVVDRYINIEKDLSVIEKVNILLDSLFKTNFKGAKLECLGVTSVEGIKILKVNMVESENLVDDHFHNMDRTWYKYFQGSEGGGNTTMRLMETILQRQYKGDWIDAVFFYWNNEPFPFEGMQHVKLSGIITRYDLRIDRRELQDLFEKQNQSKH